MKNKFSIFFVPFILSGCTLQEPISPKNASPVPQTRLYLHQESNDASIVVTRDKGYYGSLCSVDFYIDGKLAAKFDPGEVAAFNVTKGSHILGVSTSGICSGAPLNENEVNIDVGDSVRRRISSDGTTGYHIQPTAF